MFISGILLFEAIYAYRLGDAGKPSLDYWALFILLLSFPLVYALAERPGFFPLLNDTGEVRETYRVIVLYVSFGFFTLACFTSRSLLKGMFSWTPLRWLGNMSYSYYLIHGLTLKAVALVMLRVIPPSTVSTAAFWIGLPIFFFLTLVSSTMLFILIEKRFSIFSPSSSPTGDKVAQAHEVATADGGVALATEVNLQQLGGS
jgi:peptidoglycan/LPS O-acetylase OafA/YrhL